MLGGDASDAVVCVGQHTLGIAEQAGGLRLTVLQGGLVLGEQLRHIECCRIFCTLGGRTLQDINVGSQSTLHRDSLQVPYLLVSMETGFFLLFFLEILQSEVC